jgi:glycosyltransferase involved in cell wall biosynthesis
MDLNLVSSEHAKKVFQNAKFEKRDSRNNQIIDIIELKKPIEILFEGADIDVYKPVSKEEIKFINLDEVKESFAYLFVGHWMQGNLGEDRKNVGLLVKAFYETFKNQPSPPALILKTSATGASYIDRENILDRIRIIKNTVKANTLPNVYLLHGEFTDSEMNELYNHPKVKAMVSLTKGEGFGRPLLEFSLTKKPIITTNWSGHLDFLHKNFNILLGGELKNVDPSASVQDMILTESQWFNVNLIEVNNALTDLYKNYKNYIESGKKQAARSRNHFSYNQMKNLLDTTLINHLPIFPQEVQLKLPELKLL